MGGSDAYRFDGRYGNFLTLQGSRNSALTPPQNLIFRPEELWNIDTKLDDGKPGIGKLRVRARNSTWPTCTDSDVAATANYVLATRELACNRFYVFN